MKLSDSISACYKVIDLKSEVSLNLHKCKVEHIYQEKGPAKYKQTSLANLEAEPGSICSFIFFFFTVCFHPCV